MTADPIPRCSARVILGALTCGQCGRCGMQARHAWKVHCPSHDDPDPSLSVTDKDGTCLVFCHAGCSQEAVIDELRRRGLWARAPMGKETRRTKANKGSGTTVRRPDQQFRYQIKDLEGRIAAVHIRMEFSDGSKEFIWEQPDGTSGLAGTRVADLPLYGTETLLDLPDGAEVVVTEGEKAAEALWTKGIPAVGTVTGASATPGPDALQPLRRLVPILWPDNDDPGRDHMDRIAAQLTGLS